MPELRFNPQLVDRLQHAEVVAENFAQNFVHLRGIALKWFSQGFSMIMPTIIVLTALGLLVYMVGVGRDNSVIAKSELHANSADYRTLKLERTLRRLEGEVTNLKRIITSRR